MVGLYHLNVLLFNRNESITVENVYGISRGIEDSQFRKDIDNHQLLFHASSVHNFVGILSR